MPQPPCVPKKSPAGRQAGREPRTGGEETSGGHGTILIVDADETTYLRCLAGGVAGCILVHRSTQLAGYEFFLHNPVDLVLLDHSPEAPCLLLLQQMRAIRPSVPVLIATAHGSEELAISVFRCGARDYFRKPLLYDEVELTIQTLLRERGRKEKKALPARMEGMEKALRHIDANFRSPLRLEAVAWEAGMSVSSFARAFKKKSGLTFTVHVNGLRVATAKNLLADSRLSILDIALACGFRNQSHFNRIFKKLTRSTPGEYRKSLLPPFPL